jgi:hypothetical protein
VIYAEAHKELILTTIAAVEWDTNILLIAGEGTNYTCNFVSNNIFHLKDEDFLSLNGGILELVQKSKSLKDYSFIITDGDCYVKMTHIEIKYISPINSIICMNEGGRLYIEYFTVRNEYKNWIGPIIYFRNVIFPIVIHFYSLNITNCYYSTVTNIQSALLYSSNSSINYEFCFVNISCMYVRNVTTVLSTFGNGGLCYCFIYNSLGIIFDLFLFFFFSSFVLLFVY